MYEPGDAFPINGRTQKKADGCPSTVLCEFRLRSVSRSGINVRLSADETAT